MPNTSSITRRSQRHRHRRRSLSRKRLRGYSVRRTRRWAKRKGGSLGRRGRSLRGGAVGIRGCLVEGGGGKHRRGGEQYGEEDGNWFVDIQPEKRLKGKFDFVLRITAEQLPFNCKTLKEYIDSFPTVRVRGFNFIDLPKLDEDQPVEYVITQSEDTSLEFVQINGIYATRGREKIGVYLIKDVNKDLLYTTHPTEIREFKWEPINDEMYTKVPRGAYYYDATKNQVNLYNVYIKVAKTQRKLMFKRTYHSKELVCKEINVDNDLANKEGNYPNQNITFTVTSDGKEHSVTIILLNLRLTSYSQYKDFIQKFNNIMDDSSTKLITYDYYKKRSSAKARL